MSTLHPSGTYHHQQVVHAPRAHSDYQVEAYYRHHPEQQQHLQQQDQRMQTPRRYSQPVYSHQDDYERPRDRDRDRERDSKDKHRNENPLMTVWRETYEVWDGVLEVVGKAWFKMGGK